MQGNYVWDIALVRRGLTLAETEGQDQYGRSICACCKNSAVQEVTSHRHANGYEYC